MTRRSRLKAALAIAGLVVAGVVVVPQVAYAADGPFNIDGNIPDANTTELADQFGNV